MLCMSCVPTTARRMSWKVRIIERKNRGIRNQGEKWDCYTYAGGIWGMVGGCGVDKLQTLLNRTLRSVIGLGRGDAGVALAPIYRELGVLRIKAIVASARARAFCKASNLHTFICDLVGSPIISRHTTWTSGTVRWLGKWVRWSQVKEIGGIPNWENLDPEKLT